MDLFEQIRRREIEQKSAKEQKAKDIQESVKNADKGFFDDDNATANDKNATKGLIVNEDLLKFRPKELKTVFVDHEFEVPEIVVTPATPETSSNLMTLVDLEGKMGRKQEEREAFFRKLMEEKKPMLSRQQSNPTTIDMTKEESFAKYIEAEANLDSQSS